VVNATPRPLYLRERAGTHCIGGRVGLKAGLDRWAKSRPQTGFDPRTVQPVARRYTDWAIPAHDIQEDQNLNFRRRAEHPVSTEIVQMCNLCNWVSESYRGVQ
jgi:hypothetical protein